MGEFPSGQRGQTVNLLRLASMVRIRPLPPSCFKSEPPVYICKWNVRLCVLAKAHKNKRVASEEISLLATLLFTLSYRSL